MRTSGQGSAGFHLTGCLCNVVVEALAYVLLWLVACLCVAVAGGLWFVVGQ